MLSEVTIGSSSFYHTVTLHIDSIIFYIYSIDVPFRTNDVTIGWKAFYRLLPSHVYYDKSNS